MDSIFVDISDTVYLEQGNIPNHGRRVQVATEELRVPLSRTTV